MARKFLVFVVMLASCSATLQVTFAANQRDASKPWDFHIKPSKVNKYGHLPVSGRQEFTWLAIVLVGTGFSSLFLGVFPDHEHGGFFRNTSHLGYMLLGFGLFTVIFTAIEYSYFRWKKNTPKRKVLIYHIIEALIFFALMLGGGLGSKIVAYGLQKRS